MNVLVTGCKGQLGTHIRLLADGSAHHYVFADVEELDITSQEAVKTFVSENEIVIRKTKINVFNIKFFIY